MSGRTVEQLEQRVLELEAEVLSLQDALAGWPSTMAEGLRAIRGITVKGIADQLRAEGDAGMARAARQGGRDPQRAQQRAENVEAALRTIADRLTSGKRADGALWDVDQVMADAEINGRLRAAVEHLLVAMALGRELLVEHPDLARRLRIAHRVLAGAPLSEVVGDDAR